MDNDFGLNFADHFGQRNRDRKKLRKISTKCLSIAIMLLKYGYLGILD